ncbi:hypothetical protein DB30_03191 [Enhygromyxa salina]|uniref:Uncharacterized protein n=1 Tax=Enhygromyxa salina TaxID=215803 RepID=A0A0C2D762_9BACT|nr:hypothetical protein [Enhygromyxa salina]KIG17490.1 hypothetical protein DB30_03191 [Enhygromyxa salina]
MRRRNIDMLPLLDVFMVVLFVFATIQESELDSTAHEIEQLEAELVEAQAIAAAEAARAATQAAQLEVQAQHEKRAAQLEAELANYQRACGPRLPGDPLCPAADPQRREQAETAVMQDQLLANIAVFQIEIAGEVDLESGRVINHCCFRADPPQGEWRRCGEVPYSRLAQSDWFDEGADGLRESLKQTREGYAIILLQQDKPASYQLTKDFAQLLQSRLRDHYVYDNGVASGQLQCPLLAREPAAPQP